MSMVVRSRPEICERPYDSRGKRPPMNARLAALLIASMAVAGCKRTEAPAAAAATATPAADPWSKPAARKDPLPRPLLWSAERDGKTTYFFGTMHMGVDPESRLPDLVWTKLDGAPTFAMETDLSAADTLDIKRHDGGTLHHDLGDAYWKKLEGALGAPTADGLDHMKPMIPATMLSMRGLPETPAMDSVLLGRATNEHKPIVYLEPLEAQTTVLDKWMNARALEEMLDDLQGNEQHAKDMVAAYIAGDDQKILALSDAERADFKRHGHTDAEFDAQLDDLLYNRNASWIGPIEKLHAEGGGFIAVGAMHLIGKRSVLDLLQQRGYKVTRLTS